MSISPDKSDVSRDIDVLLFSQATGNVEINTNGKAVAEEPSDALTNVADEINHLVPFQVARSGARSDVSVVPGSSVEAADMVAFRSHIRELHVDDADLLSRRAENQKWHTDTLLRLRAEKKTSSVL